MLKIFKCVTGTFYDNVLVWCMRTILLSIMAASWGVRVWQANGNKPQPRDLDMPVASDRVLMSVLSGL
jgi:hypothetical protein